MGAVAVLAIASSALLAGGAAFGVAARRQARKLLTPLRKPLDYHPQECDVVVEEVTIQGPSGKLAAWYLPASNGCTLVCCHGIHDNRGQWIRQMARLHARGGYGALMFDFCGHGESDGDLVTYGAREAEEIGAVISYLRARRRGARAAGGDGLLARGNHRRSGRRALP